METGRAVENARALLTTPRPGRHPSTDFVPTGSSTSARRPSLWTGRPSSGANSHKRPTFAKSPHGIRPAVRGESETVGDDGACFRAEPDDGCRAGASIRAG